MTPLTLLQAVMALGRMGGHMGRKGDGFPGWQTLWRGYIRLHMMLYGAAVLLTDLLSLEQKVRRRDNQNRING